MPEISKIPQHVAIIMDGNGRWAKQRGLPRNEGHAKGQDALRRTLEAAGEMGVKVLTVYAFSTENWHRPQEEVEALMDLLVKALRSEVAELISRGIRLKAIGDLSRLSHETLLALDEVVERTSSGDKMTLVLALSYSSRDELTRTMTRIGEQIQIGELNPEDVSEGLIESSLDTADLPPLDLLIRTGGEYRISNFLLWQAAYAELFFSSYYWPDFGKEALLEALQSYADRERRFGLTSEQIEELSGEES